MPSSAQPGQPIGVTLSILGWNGPITDPAELAQMQVGVSVSGDSLSGPTEIPVSNAGESTGTPTGSGDYKGTFTAPRATGTLTFTGTAAGYGLYATHMPTTVQVGTTAGTLQAAVQLPLAAKVQAGQSLTGTVVFSNGTGAAHQVRLLLNVSHADATITRPAPSTCRRAARRPARSASRSRRARRSARPGCRSRSSTPATRRSSTARRPASSR